MTNREKRKKAFIGAAVQLVGQVVGGILQKKAQDKADSIVAYAQNKSDALQTANNLQAGFNTNLDEFNQHLVKLGGKHRTKAELGTEEESKGFNYNELASGAIGAVGNVIGALFNSAAIKNRKVSSSIPNIANNTNNNIMTPAYVDRFQNQMRCGGKRKFRGGGIASRHQGKAKSFSDSPFGQFLHDLDASWLPFVKRRTSEGGSFGGGRTGGAGAGNLSDNVTKVVTDTIPGDTIIVPREQTFNEAFSEARKRGDKQFEFNGGQYNTEFGDNPNNYTAGQKRRRIQLMPIVTDTVYRDRYVTERGW